MAVVSEYEYYGRVAFEGHRLYYNGVDTDGARLPEWDELGETAQQAWIAGGTAAVNAYLGES